MLSSHVLGRTQLIQLMTFLEERISCLFVFIVFAFTQQSAGCNDTIVLLTIIVININIYPTTFKIMFTNVQCKSVKCLPGT